MKGLSESVLRWWAITAMLIVVLIIITPIETIERITEQLSSPSTVNYIARTLIVTIVLVLVAGFHLYMLCECGFGKSVYHQGLWLMLLILIPLLSAFAYFWITRSTAYIAYVRKNREGG